MTRKEELISEVWSVLNQYNDDCTSGGEFSENAFYLLDTVLTYLEELEED